MDNMLQHLLSKDVLYEQMKEIAAKYPPWIKKNKKNLPDEEVIRYEAQLVKVRAIVTAFEDENTDFAKVVTLLQEMQSFGLPPDEIMKELKDQGMAPGVGADGAPMFAPRGAYAPGGSAAGGGAGGGGAAGAGGEQHECVVM